MSLYNIRKALDFQYASTTAFKVCTWLLALTGSHSDDVNVALVSCSDDVSIPSVPRSHRFSVLCLNVDSCYIAMYGFPVT